MTHTISVPFSEYCKWPSYKRWLKSTVYSPFSEFAKKHYSDYILSVEFSYTDSSDMNRLFTFKSEEHYTWFLLIWN